MAGAGSSAPSSASCCGPRRPRSSTSSARRATSPSTPSCTSPCRCWASRRCSPRWRARATCAGAQDTRTPLVVAVVSGAREPRASSSCSSTASTSASARRQRRRSWSSGARRRCTCARSAARAPGTGVGLAPDPASLRRLLVVAGALVVRTMALRGALAAGHRDRRPHRDDRRRRPPDRLRAVERARPRSRRPRHRRPVPRRRAPRRRRRRALLASPATACSSWACSPGSRRRSSSPAVASSCPSCSPTTPRSPRSPPSSCGGRRRCSRSTPSCSSSTGCSSAPATCASSPAPCPRAFAVFAVAGGAVLVADGGIGWLWAAIGVFMVARLVPLAVRWRNGAWAVVGAVRSLEMHRAEGRTVGAEEPVDACQAPPPTRAARDRRRPVAGP